MSAEAERRAHWRQLYRTKPVDAVSWYQARPEVSLEMIAATGLSTDAGIVDVGGGASTLVDHLLAAGFTDLAVLDVAEAALAAARDRLGARAGRVEWITADVTDWTPHRHWRLWHDRAVFHFLVEKADRQAYLAALTRAVPKAAHVIIATFAPDGPEACSGLPVRRYSEAGLRRTLGERFAFVDSRRETHRTPSGGAQPFLYQHFVRRF